MGRRRKLYRGYWRRAWQAIYIKDNRVLPGDFVEVKKQVTKPPYELLEVAEILFNGVFGDGTKYSYIKPVCEDNDGRPGRPRPHVISKSYQSTLR